MYQTVSIRSLHLEYQLWVRELIFYKEEIKIFESHLEDLVSRNTRQGVQVQIEHFQNQFICQKEVIDILKHKLNISERQLAAFVYDLSGGVIDSIRMDNHSELREEIQTFRRLYKKLKTYFRHFETEWM
ncbi:hypothetical protein [Flavisolibacter ginsengisoli]|jgi:hypothetical protein|uniref:Uncharacterized protein n=1 Tax=Flavisolibacter ginsengisoli DSM 18119 TaxID=1121884 RepID=A0A1M5C209_9BACT|nr:hypothetical protein [Flavisolibacter ginsengisoli]SHF48647.1 hypothetical protein SAMN02745131_02780 [Flavisolibacter ginsengisoli DSM 18119]